MGYLFLSLALISSKIKAFCSKKLSSITNNHLTYFLLSIARMSLCIIIGFVFVLLATKNVKSFSTDVTTLIISAVSGFSSATFVVSWLISIRTSAFAMLDVFITLGITVPLLLSNFLFGERITAVQWLGMALLVVSVYIMCLYSNRVKTKITFKNLIMLLVCGFFNGLSHFTEKWFSYHAEYISTTGKGYIDTSIFNFYTYLFATVVLLIGYFVLRAYLRTNQTRVPTQETLPIKKTISLISLMSLCLFLHSYFCTLAASKLSASELYPLQQGLSLILSVLMSKFLFKEKITLKCIFGVVLAFVSLFIINVLPSLISI